MVNAYLKHESVSLGRQIVRLFSALFLLLMVSGCSAVDRNVNFLYQPTALGTGGSGDLYLCQSVQPASDKDRKVEWIIGVTKNDASEDTGNIVTSRMPVETVMDAFAREFKGAGYNVIPVDTLPAGVAKGIRITKVSFKLDEIDRIYQVESKCTVKISIEPWVNGTAVKRLDYESIYEDSTVLDRDTLLLKSLQSALQQIMARAVKEAIVVLEKR